MDRDDLNLNIPDGEDDINPQTEYENRLENDQVNVTNTEMVEENSSVNLDTDDVVHNLLGSDVETSKKSNKIDTDPKNNFVSNSKNDTFDSVVDNSVELNLNNSSLTNEESEKSIEERNDILENDENLADSFDIDSIINVSSKENTEPKGDKLCQFPLGRVKSIMKSDPDVTVVSAECVFLIAKASELFLQWLGKEIHGYTVKQKKKTIQKRDLDLAISENPALEFLDGALD